MKKQENKKMSFCGCVEHRRINAMQNVSQNCHSARNKFCHPARELQDLPYKKRAERAL